MTSFSRRFGSLAVVAATFGALMVAGAPSAAADTCVTLPVVGPVCVPTPVPIPLPGGGTGVSTASPDTFANTETAQVVSITDPLSPIYGALPGGSVNVQLVGPGSATDTYNATAVSVGSGTISATFDMTSLGLPAGPGAYVLTVTPTAVPPTPLPVDSAAVTITAGQPTPVTASSVQPGHTAPLTVATSATGTGGTPFAKGDTVSFSDPGLTLTAPVVTASSIKGTLNAAAGVAVGSYDLTVTDTAGQAGTCTGCIVVTDLGPVTNLKAVATTGTNASITFSAPTGSSQPVTGYAITVSKIAGKTTTDTGITVNQTGTTPSATVTGLTPATKYFVTVAAKSASGTGASTAASFYTPHATTLTIASTRKHVKVGKPVTLIGQLTHKVGGASSGLANKRVLLFARVGNAPQPVKITTVKTDGSGKYRYAFKPKQSAAYIAFFLGTRSTSTAPGDALTFAIAPPVPVKPKVKLRAHVAKHAGGSWLVLKGKVKPKQKGHKVIIERVGHGGVKKLGTAKLTGKSTFKLVKKHLAPGTYHLRARVKTSPTNTAAHSMRRTVTL